METWLNKKKPLGESEASKLFEDLKKRSEGYLTENVVEPFAKAGYPNVGAGIATVPQTILDLIVPETPYETMPGMAGVAKLGRKAKGAFKDAFPKIEQEINKLYDKTREKNIDVDSILRKRESSISDAKTKADYKISNKKYDRKSIDYPELKDMGVNDRLYEKRAFRDKYNEKWGEEGDPLLKRFIEAVEKNKAKKIEEVTERYDFPKIKGEINELETKRKFFVKLKNDRDRLDTINNKLQAPGSDIEKLNEQKRKISERILESTKKLKDIEYVPTKIGNDINKTTSKNSIEQKPKREMGADRKAFDKIESEERLKQTLLKNIKEDELKLKKLWNDSPELNIFQHEERNKLFKDQQDIIERLRKNKDKLKDME